jgi:hypothetical protein
MAPLRRFPFDGGETSLKGLALKEMIGLRNLLRSSFDNEGDRENLWAAAEEHLN